MIEVRFFAAARAAAGVASVRAEGATLGELLDACERLVEPVDPGRWTTVLARCSFLVDGVAAQDRGAETSDAATVDVLPPFAGG